MLKRPINNRFREKVLSGNKTTTIRDKAWLVKTLIMLYSWEGLPYRSKQINLCPIQVLGFWPISITKTHDGFMIYGCGKEGEPLWASEGFDSKEDMDNWFRPLVKEGETTKKYLMKFKRT